MDLLDVVRIFFKRWYVGLPILLIAVWFAYTSYASVQPLYYANSVVTIAPPSQRIPYSEAGKPVEVNGLLEVGGPSLLTNMAVIACNDDAVKAKVMEAGGKWGYTVKNFPSPTGQTPLPLIMVESSQADAATAKNTVELAALQIDPVLQQLQRNVGVPEAQIVRAVVVTPPVPVKAFPSRTRSSLGLFAGGLVLSILAAVVTDLLVTRVAGKMRNRRVARSGPAVSTESPRHGD